MRFLWIQTRTVALKTKTAYSFFILFTIVTSIIAMTPSSAFAGNSEITIVPVAGSRTVGCENLDGCYAPNSATIDMGGKVIFSNTDNDPHTFTSGNAYDGPSKKFNSSLIGAGQSYILDTTDLELGEYDYFCIVHPWMLGLLTVQESEEVPVVDEVEVPVVDEVEVPVVDEVEVPVVDEVEVPVVDEVEVPETTPPDSGCLIATAAYGTELAPQVQLLREIRDSTLFSTTSGTAFMSGFNTVYYSFAPTVADWERENPVFKGAVKTMITPMLSTLSIMSLADEGSEAEVLGLGISVIALNLGMYVGIPAFGILKLYQFKRN